MSLFYKLQSMLTLAAVNWLRFDFQKTTYIVSLEPEMSCLKKLVLRLGPFHAEMSFLGCIGHLM